MPYGEELAAAFAALPNIPDPVSHGTANFSGGTFNTGPAGHGAAQLVTFAARVFSYVPCFFAVRCLPLPLLWHKSRSCLWHSLAHEHALHATDLSSGAAPSTLRPTCS